MSSKTLVYILKRIGLAILTVWVVITVTFFVMRIVPGGNHSEASWEKQIPIFMDCLGL